MADEKKFVVIATTNCEKGLFIVAKDAVLCHNMEIRFTEKYAPTVEYLLRILRKGFGWMEVERGIKEVKNTKCKYNLGGHCDNKKVSESKNNRMKCSESIRNSCNHYSQKRSNLITVNFVEIEKAGQIRDL